MIDDKELIRKFTAGDEKAFDQIVQNNLNNVFGFFMKITRDEMAAEDLTQDVFLKLYKNLKNFRYESNFSTYLYRINSNTANSWITRNKWKGMLHLEQIAEEGKYDQKNDFEWTRQELWEEIAKLPKKQRKVVILRVTDGLSYRDISEITGMSEGTAKVNFHHGLKRLKEKLNNISDAFLEGLIIRTYPNSKIKMSQDYMQQPPPFFSIDAMKYLRERGVEHLLVDTPSVDRLYDDGILSSHNIFWDTEAKKYNSNTKNYTITEMIYVDEKIEDGKYLLNLQIPSFVSDAAPSRPLIFKLNDI